MNTTNTLLYNYLQVVVWFRVFRWLRWSHESWAKCGDWWWTKFAWAESLRILSKPEMRLCSKKVHGSLISQLLFSSSRTGGSKVSKNCQYPAFGNTPVESSPPGGSYCQIQADKRWFHEISCLSLAGADLLWCLSHIEETRPFFCSRELCTRFSEIPVCFDEN